MIRVLLADDHDIVRAGLRRLVEECGDMEVVAEAADGQEAIRQVQETSPEVAVIDISMPGLDGLEVVSRLRLSHPKLPILILTMHEEEQYVVRAIEAGAKGYITKRSAPELLVKAIRKVHAGGRFLPMPPLRPWRCAWPGAPMAACPWTLCPPGKSRFCGIWPWARRSGRLPRPIT